MGSVLEFHALMDFRTPARPISIVEATVYLVMRKRPVALMKTVSVIGAMGVYVRFLPVMMEFLTRTSQISTAVEVYALPVLTIGSVGSMRTVLEETATLDSV